MANFLAIGAHIVDVLVRPVDLVPDRQVSTRVDDMVITPAGTAAGTAVALARLGGQVRTVGVVGTDLLGDVLIQSMQREGIDTGSVRRDPDTPTSGTVLPIRSNGVRPSLHFVGANAKLELRDVPLSQVAQSDVVHVGGLDRFPEILTHVGLRVLEEARAGGAVTSMDLLGPCDREAFERLKPLLGLVDYFFPNDDQVLDLTGAASLEEGVELLCASGVANLVVTCGESGTLWANGAQRIRYPSHRVDVVDTTGCGDAFAAGFLTSIFRGGTPRDALAMATAAAGIVAQGLGSNAGLTSWDQVVAFSQECPLKV